MARGRPADVCRQCHRLGYLAPVCHQETDWVNTFWLHFLIICAIQYVLLLIIVTLGMVVPTFRAMYKRPVEALHHE